MIMQRYTIPALIIVVSLAIFFGYIRGAYAKIEQGIKQKEELNDYLEQATRAQEKLNALSETVRGFPPDAEERLAVMIPETIDEVKFYMEFQELSKKSGVVFNEMNSRMAKEGIREDDKGFVPNEMNFTIDASYTTFRKFLRVIERSLALREMGALNFQTNKDLADGTKGYRAPDPANDIYSYAVTITSYSMK